jgi:opacity protein-like surface antigen
MNVLANLYLDLGNWYGFTPYVGAGVGVNVLYQRAQSQWYQGNGAPYAGVTWTDPFSNITFMANWDSQRQGTFLRVAYAFMGGVAYDIDNHWKVDLGYRFLNLGKITGQDANRVLISKDLTAHQVRLGFRYVID